MVIDANMYWFPESILENEDTASSFLSELPRVYGVDGYMQRNHQKGVNLIVIEKPSGYQNLNYVQGEYRLEKQLADMDEAGVEKAVLKLPGCHEWMSLDMCKKFNQGMAEHAKRSKGRLVPLAVVPPYASKECIKELEKCFREYGFTGIQVCAHYGNLYLDHENFTPFFEKLNMLSATVYVHHTPVPVEYDSLFNYNNLRRSYGRCVDQTTAIGRELFSGFFDKHPELKFIHSMLGGGFFAYANMLFPQKPKNQDVASRFETNDNTRKHAKENIFFEMSHAQPWGRKQLECAVSVLGAKNILFGTSYPVRKEWLTEGVAFIEALDITKEEKEMILYKNAQRLYHINL